MDVKDFIECIRDVAAPEWAEDWDNSGLMVGDRTWKVSKMAVTLDASEKTVSEAINGGCDLLVTHHPLIFSPLRKIDMSSLSSRLVFKAIENHLAIISLHTNWDVSPKGVNVCLSETLGLSKIIPLQDGINDSWGLGSLGEFPFNITMEALAGIVKEKWDLSWLMAYGPMEDKVKRVALCGGSGGDLWRTAIQKGADLYITADMKYHQILEARFKKLRLMVVDHGEMESASIPELARLLLERSGIPVKVIRYHNRDCRIFSV